MCRQLGGNLAEPRTAEITSLINGFILPHLSYWIGKFNLNAIIRYHRNKCIEYLFILAILCFIGLTDLATEGTFVWGTDFHVVEYTNWYIGEPQGGYGECCVILDDRNFKWLDFPCHSTVWHSDVYPLCEKPNVK